VLTLPPLRERREDIVLLARHFASRMAVELDLAGGAGFSATAEALLLAHPWPGNVRELKNVVERAVFRELYCAGARRIEALEFDPFASPWRRPPTDPEETSRPPDFAIPFSAPPHLPLPQEVRELEVNALRRALASARHNHKAAAALLGLSYNQFRGLLRKHKDSL